MATAEWMRLRSVTTAIPAPTTPMASRKKRTLEMSRVVGSRSKFERSMAPLGGRSILAQRQNGLRAEDGRP